MTLVEQLQAIIAQKNREYDTACEHELKLIKENHKLRAALEFYADVENYEYESEQDVGGYVHRTESLVEEDWGKLAREALEQK